MDNWIITLHLEGFYHQDDLSPKEKAGRICTVLKLRLRDYINPQSDKYCGELEDVLHEFEDFEDEHGVDGFDEIMNRLYDWCDVERVWVTTR